MKVNGEIERESISRLSRCVCVNWTCVHARGSESGIRVGVSRAPSSLSKRENRCETPGDDSSQTNPFLRRKPCSSSSLCTQLLPNRLRSMCQNVLAYLSQISIPFPDAFSFISLIHVFLAGCKIWYMKWNGQDSFPSTQRSTSFVIVAIEENFLWPGLPQISPHSIFRRIRDLKIMPPSPSCPTSHSTPPELKTRAPLSPNYNYGKS